MNIKKLIPFIIFSFLFLYPAQASADINLITYGEDDLSIKLIDEIVHIIGDDIEVEYTIEIIIRNIDKGPKNPEIGFRIDRYNDQVFSFKNIKPKFCQEKSGGYVQLNHTYDTIKLDECDIFIDATLFNDGSYFILDKTNLITKNDSATNAYFQIIFSFDDYIIKKDYTKIFWQNLNVNPVPPTVNRFLITEEDSVITSLLNYKIERYMTKEGKFILNYKELGDTQLFYESYNEKNIREFFYYLLEPCSLLFFLLWYHFFLKRQIV